MRRNNMKPNLVTKEEADKRFCPFDRNLGEVLKKRCNPNCMAFCEVIPHTCREPHSGGEMAIRKYATDNGIPWDAIREEGCGSTLVLHVDARYTCARLNNEEE
jgi:hypothetical protein